MGAMNGLKALAVALVLFGLAFGSGFQLLFRLGYAVMAVVVISFAWTSLSLVGLRLQREAPAARAQVGQRIDERFTLRNRWPIPRVWLEVRDHSSLPEHHVSRAFALGALREYSWSVRTKCQRRGVFNLGPVTILSGDPFGLFRRRRVWPVERKLVVYPATVDLQHFDITVGPLSGGDVLRQRSHHATPNTFGIRPYAPGDSLNRIHWLSTARLRSLTVKEFELDPQSDTWIVIDSDRAVQSGRGDDSTEEYAVTAGASFAKHFLRQHRSFGLISYGSHHCVLPADRGDRQFIKILEELAVLRATGRTPLAEVIAAESRRFGRNTILIVVTPSTSEQWLLALRHEARRGVRGIVVMLDGPSFDCLPSDSGLLPASDWPAYIVHRGDDLSVALSRTVDGQGA